MDPHTRWMAVAADILNAPTPGLAHDLFADELMRQTRTELVARIALPRPDPDAITITVEARQTVPPREHWPVAAQARAHPLSRYYSTTTDRSPVRLTDLIAAGWRLLPEQRDAMGALGITVHQMTLPCGADDGSFDGWVAINEDGFSDDALAELTGLQGLLVGLDRHVQMFARLSGSHDPAAADGPALTPRERLVLDLLAAGSTAEGIAARLAISPRTVHKHQENLYRKLGACDRLSAVLSAQQLGLLPAPGGALTTEPQRPVAPQPNAAQRHTT
ncbi:helix-turn-helix transcriptional regulator [Intrasporangium chromatireducens]|uniref:helix-turn-helix transcriptional regulator n=1 Tax=Intrasporangium chromatireducens TaxID=1386088 RepID=UPI001969C193|nr:LuxR C-terminal-related transcriptional regulator [Intrasporangium chromatireducens]